MEADKVVELGTFDVVVEATDHSIRIHGITTLYSVKVGKQPYALDRQSSTADWRTVDEWLVLELHPFIHQSLVGFKKRKAG